MATIIVGIQRKCLSVHSSSLCLLNTCGFMLRNVRILVFFLPKVSYYGTLLENPTLGIQRYIKAYLEAYKLG